MWDCLEWGLSGGKQFFCVKLLLGLKQWSRPGASHKLLGKHRINFSTAENRNCYINKSCDLVLNTFSA